MVKTMIMLPLSTQGSYTFDRPKMRFHNLTLCEESTNRTAEQHELCQSPKQFGELATLEGAMAIPSAPSKPKSSEDTIYSDVETAAFYASDSTGIHDTSNPTMILFRRHPQFIEHDPGDAPYVGFFLIRVKSVLPYFEIFPNMISDIFSRAIMDRGLFHTVLSVSHLIADCRLHRSLTPVLDHQTRALALIQQSISAMDITETLAISVAMLVWLNIQCGNRHAAIQHLHGLNLIFEEIRNQSQKQSTFLMQIWRFSIRLDVTAAIYFFPLTPSFSMASMDIDSLHRDWVRLSTPAHLESEWTLASFALDNLMNQACHVAVKAYDLRRTNPSFCYAQIQNWTEGLLLEHGRWRSRALIVQSDIYEQKANKVATDGVWGRRFLDCPPLLIHNQFYVNLLNAWRSVYIFIDLIRTPEIGPVLGNPARYSYAIDICRTYASLGKDNMFPIGKMLNVFLAGFALGGKRTSPREVEWLHDFILRPLQENLPLNRTAVVSLLFNMCANIESDYISLWEQKSSIWDAIKALNSRLSYYM